MISSTPVILLTDILGCCLIVIVLVKFSRQNSIHVSPTVLWDGLVANEVSSSWGEKEWNEFLATKVAI